MFPRDRVALAYFLETGGGGKAVSFCIWERGALSPSLRPCPWHLVGSLGFAQDFCSSRARASSGLKGTGSRTLCGRKGPWPDDHPSPIPGPWQSAGRVAVETRPVPCTPTTQFQPHEELRYVLEMLGTPQCLRRRVVCRVDTSRGGYPRMAATSALREHPDWRTDFSYRLVCSVCCCTDCM